MLHDGTRKSTRTPSSFLPGQGRDEFRRVPIALLTDRVPKGQRSIKFEDKVYSTTGGRSCIPRKRVIEGSEEYGLPTATDDTVILALIQLTKLKNIQPGRSNSPGWS